MSSEKGPKRIYIQEHNLYYYYYHFWRALGKYQLKKMTTKQSEQSREGLQVEQLLFSLNENTQYIMGRWLNITKSCHLSFQKLQMTLKGSLIKLICKCKCELYFSGLKYILARKMRCNARQSNNNSKLPRRRPKDASQTLEQNLIKA